MATNPALRSSPNPVLSHSDHVVGSSSEESVSSSMITSVVNDVDRDQQESARSQVLRNEDLLGLIMELMEEPPPAIVLMNIQKPNRRYFLWASLACKAFFGPAMNILWHSIFSLEVIIKLIPTLEKDEHNCYNMTQAILPEHLKRFELYTRRIRKFRFPSGEGLNFSVSPHVYLAIAKSRGMQPITSLTELFIPEAGLLAQFPGIFLLSSQTLNSVYLYRVGDGEPVVTSLLHDISSKECNIQRMGICGKLTSKFLDTLSTFKYLDSVHIVNGNLHLTTEEFLRPFSCLKTLKNLQFTFVEDSKSTFSKNQRGGKPLGFTFSTLKILTVMGSALNIATILHSMFPPELVDIRVIITSMEGTPMAVELCTKIIRSWKAPHLRALQFISDDRGELYTDYYVLSYQMIGQSRQGPLGCPIPSNGLSHISQLHCPLESVHLEIDPYFLNPSIVHIFEKSFTSLKRLELRSSISTSVESWSPTETENLMRLSEMDIFASHFPNLEVLIICTVFELEEMKEMKQKSENQDIGGHNLQELVLLPFPHHADSLFAPITSIMDAFGVARYLDHLFPTMTTLDLSECVKINTLWRQAVLDMVEEFQEVRRIANSRSLIVQGARPGSSLNSAVA